jgi:type IV pilus assembly protein PilA
VKHPNRQSHIHGGGFTLIEILIVMVILAVLMAIALPLYLGATFNSEIATCRSNMQSIADAESAYRTRTPTHTFTTTLANLSGDLLNMPLCPSNGTYSVAISDGTLTAHNGKTVPAGGVIVKCTAAGHDVYAPGIDSD